MTVHDQDLLAAVARHLVGGLLQQGQLKPAAIGHGAGLVLRFRDLSEVVFGKNDDVFLFRGVQSGITHVEQIGAQGEVRSMLLDDSEWQQTRALRTLDAFAEISGGEFFPVHGELAGGSRGLRLGARHKNNKSSKKT